ncbi:CoA pyrophosphatase [Oceanispirochaeta crateris]|uniref:CoA pyrophosphatase n=1 Tax=Oceanispirochaeta crateris TaxID=2518645 RepID=A0A5C1QI13_9SPIO|nr:CoA pyrophosphatase [Oceanispirochaeta crateris]QEN06759.1 CoA pyrophosphatase [Oceanispirochaeta crateris]
MNFQKIREQLIPDDHCPRIIGREYMLSSAVLIPLILNQKEPKGCPSILFQKRAPHIRQGGEICFPGGRFDKEKDQSFLMTALRETSEEIGIQTSHIDVLGSTGTLVTPMNILVQPYLGVLQIQDISELKANREEVEALFTIPLSWFAENPPTQFKVPIRAHPYSEDPLTGEVEYHFPTDVMKLPERYHHPWEGDSRHRIWAYSTTHGVLWGITAQILRDTLPLLLNNE